MSRYAGPNYYEILGVGRRAGADELKTAWRRVAKATHPDSPTGNQALFVLAQAAYETLSDPYSRADYDRQLDDQSDCPPDGGSAPSGSDVWVVDDTVWAVDDTGVPRGWGRRVYATPRRETALDRFAVVVWLAFSVVMSLRNLAWWLQLHQDSPVLVHLGGGFGIFVVSLVVLAGLGARVLPRVSWPTRLLMVAAALTFPLVVWSPLACVAAGVGYRVLRSRVWPPPTARLRLALSRLRGAAQR